MAKAKAASSKSDPAVVHVRELVRKRLREFYTSAVGVTRSGKNVLNVRYPDGTAIRIAIERV
jgi:hypothetical protein